MEDRVPALLAQASSKRWAERTEAGVLLASCADDPRTHAALRTLLLDADNTWVTAETAVALLRRADSQGLRLFVLAYHEADPDFGTLDELHALLYDDELCDWKALRPVLETLTHDEDGVTREAACEVLEDLTITGR